MFVDASALTAMLTNEDDALDLLTRLQAEDRRLTSPLAVWEATIAVARILDLPIAEASKSMAAYLDLIGVKLVSVSPETAYIALDAFDRYGKGRHPARLNFGDCFSYACATQLGEALLFKGEDFPLTDIQSA